MVHTCRLARIVFQRFYNSKIDPKLVVTRNLTMREREGRRRERGGERGEERGGRERGGGRDREVTYMYVHIVNTLPATISKLATRLSGWYHRNGENNYQTLYYRDAEVFSLSHELIQCPCKQLGLFIISHALIARQ